MGLKTMVDDKGKLCALCCQPTMNIHRILKKLGVWDWFADCSGCPQAAHSLLPTYPVASTRKSDVRRNGAVFWLEYTKEPTTGLQHLVPASVFG